MTRFIKTVSGAVMVLLGAAIFGGAVTAGETVVNEASFGCMREGVKVRDTYIRHADPDKLQEAVRIFQHGIKDAEYPVGTIIQLVPNEAMVKGSKEEFPNSDGWEFFALDVTAQATTIKSRGDTAQNIGPPCLSCHQPGAKFDYICDKGHGCAPIPITDEQIRALQAKDPRCPAK